MFPENAIAPPGWIAGSVVQAQQASAAHPDGADAVLVFDFVVVGVFTFIFLHSFFSKIKTDVAIKKISNVFSLSVPLADAVREAWVGVQGDHGHPGPARPVPHPVHILCGAGQRT
jgi:hypothetical protein